ncbi:hypothetical protein HY486_03380, partial [Candidatus Woesearchaeota archaeon]|nr:hypothetical protein [Candidatus Woesearchaeota archaeon]
TIHCAITYFDPETKSAGYLVGSDSRAAIKVVAGEALKNIKKVFWVDKSFRGRDTIGVIRGRLLVKGREPQNKFSIVMQSLENLFDGIDEGADYSDVPVLGDFEQYILLIGKRTNSTLDLYTVSNIRKDNLNIAKRLHRLTPEMYHTENGTLFWYAPNTPDYLEIRLSKRCDAKEAQYFLEKLLTGPLSISMKRVLKMDRGYDPGKPNIYRLNFQGILRISETSQ